MSVSLPQTVSSPIGGGVRPGAASFLPSSLWHLWLLILLVSGPLFAQDDPLNKVHVPPPSAASAEGNAAGGLPDQPPVEQVQRIIHGNLMAVRGCFMSIARTGQARSGKAIVSFTIGAAGRAAGLRVDAPTFVDTPLPGCVTAQVSHWEFPKSQKGGGQVSYPFVFVGG